MKVRSPSIHITLQSIDDISLACINPPVNRRYASNFKSKLAEFVATIHQSTLMNIMEYLIKFKEQYLILREGSKSSILLYEDLLIISIFKVNQNQLMHTEMALILAKLEELLGRTKRALQVRCFNYLIHLTEQEINQAVITNLNCQTIEVRKGIKYQKSINRIIGQRMAAIQIGFTYR